LKVKTFLPDFITEAISHDLPKLRTLESFCFSTEILASDLS
jgi:hypothetical protein